MERKWHAYAESFPLMTGEPYRDLKESIELHGQDKPIYYRVVGGKRQYLDGRNRAQACDDIGIDPWEERVEIGDVDVESFIDRANAVRRHLSPEDQEKNRAKRLIRVAQARAEGQSLRDIAKTEGVSTTTVVNDLQSVANSTKPDKKRLATTSVVNGFTTEVVQDTKPDKVTGKDGKKYPAAKPARSGADCVISRNGNPETPPKSGKPIFDDRPFQELYGKLARWLNDRHTAKGGKGHDAVMKAMNDLAKSFKKWCEETP